MTGPHTQVIAFAADALRPHRVDGRLFGDVAACLETTGGARHTGVCIDTGSGTGFCAEAAAIAAMVTAGEYAISQIVAVWRDADDQLYVVPPCGRCREFIRQIDESNLDTLIVLDHDEHAPLRTLLPRHEWPEPLRPQGGS